MEALGRVRFRSPAKDTISSIGRKLSEAIEWRSHGLVAGAAVG